MSCFNCCSSKRSALREPNTAMSMCTHLILCNAGTMCRRYRDIRNSLRCAKGVPDFVNWFRDHEHRVVSDTRNHSTNVAELV